ncbi:MAG TPA: hypothetical protein VGX91_02530 [Candidatus Cybelea sp.]|nr:hypothetical protein [Candidatus Cybelea sp.]
MIQHALYSVPNRATGYCTDDVARGFIVALGHLRLAGNDRLAHRLAGTYLAYLQHAQMENGLFHNFMDYDRRWADDCGTQDCCGRAIWALGYGVSASPSQSWRRVCAALLDRVLASSPLPESLVYLRSRAYAALGLSYAYAASKDERYAEALRQLTGAMLAQYESCATADWPWFEETMTYDNARLPEAMIRSGAVLGEPSYHAAGLTALRFYERVTVENGVFVPIGNDGWYRRGGPRARYGQQPLEACAMVDAQLAAFDLTGEIAHFAGAELALEWYYGKNSRGIVMVAGGGCYDGLEKDAVNYNMGAESTLALLAAAYALAARRGRVLRAVR